MARVPRRDVRYADDPFGRAVRAAVADRLQARGLTPTGGRRLWIKAVVITAWVLGSYSVLVWAPISSLVTALATVSLGLASAGMAMSVKHDALHRAFSSRRAVNTGVAHVATFYGLSASWWKHKHNRLHHGFTNVAGVDDDIDQGRLVRLSVTQAWRPWHRWQHLYMWGVYPFLFYLSGMLGADLAYVLFGRIGGRQVGPPGVCRALVRLADKLKGLVLLVGVALLFHPAAAVVAVAFAASVIMGTVWSVNIVVQHTFESDAFLEAEPVSRRVGLGWAEAQVRGTANVAVRNPVWRWYVGGLNRHIEHHLFPRLSHVHLDEIAPIVRSECRRHGLPYCEFPSVWSALAAHHRFLRELGRCPAPVELPSAHVVA